MEKNNSLLLIMVASLLICLFSGLAGYYIKSEEGGKLTIKASNVTEDNKELETKCPEVTCTDDEKQCVCPACNTEDKNYIVVKDNGGNDWYNLYAYYEADGQPQTVIDYKGELYLLSIYGENSCVWQMDNNTLIFENDYASCQGDMPTEIRKLNIKTADISKVIIANDLSTTDAQYRLFYIYKNGSVTEAKYGEGAMVKTNRFPDLKVKDLKYYCIKDDGNDSCDEKGFELTLIDGTKKTVNY